MLRVETYLESVVFCHLPYWNFWLRSYADVRLRYEFLLLCWFKAVRRRPHHRNAINPGENWHFELPYLKQSKISWQCLMVVNRLWTTAWWRKSRKLLNFLEIAGKVVIAIEVHCWSFWASDFVWSGTWRRLQKQRPTLCSFQGWGCMDWIERKVGSKDQVNEKYLK